MLTARQHARQILRPLFGRPVTPEQRNVTDRLTGLLEAYDGRIETLEQKIDEQSDDIDAMDYDQHPTDPHHGGKMSSAQMAMRIEWLERESNHHNNNWRSVERQVREYGLRIDWLEGQPIIKKRDRFG